MRSLLTLSCCALCLVAGASPARAQSAPATGPKPPEIRTALPPALSPRLSADQLAKQKLVPPPDRAAPAETPAWTKAAARVTSLPPDPALLAAHAQAAADKLARPLRAQLASDLALAQGRPPALAGSAAAATKPAPLTTSLSVTEAQARTHASGEAAKLARTHVRAGTAAGRKPALIQTGGGTPAALTPEQAAKRAQAAAAAAGRPQ